MYSYFVRLVGTDDVLLSEALTVSKSIANECKTGWFNCIKSLSAYVDIDLNNISKWQKNFKHIIYNKFKVKYNKIQCTSLQDDRENKSSGNKLRTYTRLFKRNI